MNNFNNPIAGCMRWGQWGANFSSSDYSNLIESCLKEGITCFDHADIYGAYTTEAEFGHALQAMQGVRRQIQLITKCGICMPSENRPEYVSKTYNTSAEHIIYSTENSLRNFKTDYIDVLLIHRPSPLLQPEEVAEAVTQLKKTGKILEFGVSNFLPHQADMLLKCVEIAFNQIEISILNIQAFTNGQLDHCIKHHIKPMAWAPLGGGLLSDDTHPRFRAITTIASKLARQYNTGLNEILIAWLLSHPAGIIPVVGTTKLERLMQARNASIISLTSDEWFQLYSASLGEEIP